MNSFDIRPRNQGGIKLIFATRVGHHVVAKPSGRVPIVMHENNWLRMKVWEQKKDVWKRAAKPVNVTKVIGALKSLDHGTVRQIAKEAGISKPTVTRVLHQLHDHDPKQAYIWNWDTGDGFERTMIWALGNKDDAPRPPKQSDDVRRQNMKKYRRDYEARVVDRKSKVSKPVVIPIRDELTAAFFGVAA